MHGSRRYQKIWLAFGAIGRYHYQEMPKLVPNERLRAFRIRLGLTVRGAAEQLRVVHPAYIDWESGTQVPTQPYRDAIEVWTSGDIRASEWPLKEREAEIVEKAAQVKAAVPASSGKLPDDEDEKPRRRTGTDERRRC